jgi:cytochrome P450
MAIFLGFPREDCDRLRQLGMDFLARNIGDPQPPAASDEAGIALMDYFHDICRQRAAHPTADVLSTISTASIDGQPIGDSAEGMALLLFVGGFENVGCSITNTLYWLAKHPDQRSWLAANPSQIPAAVEEALRFDAPQQNFKRTTTRDVELSGVQIPAGQPVILLYGSANRDERRLDHPDHFDIQREPKHHLAFGHGIHHCIGAPLARLEAQIVLETMLKETPTYELTGNPKRLPSHAVRGFAELPGNGFTESRRHNALMPQQPLDGGGRRCGQASSISPRMGAAGMLARGATTCGRATGW